MRLSPNLLLPFTVIPLATCQTCFSPTPTNYEQSIIPLHRTNPDSFLYPILKWGPTNQVQGLFESIKLAINTNRTLVLPPMFLHFNDKQSISENKIIDSSIRINTNAIRKFINTVSPSEYYKKCGRTAEKLIIPAGDSLYGPNTRLFQYYSGMDLVSPTRLAKVETTKNVSEIGECMVLSRPYRNIPLNVKMEFRLNVVDLPEYIYELLKTHVEYSEIDWAVHWRFSVGDWSRRCSEDRIVERKGSRTTKSVNQNAECQMFDNMTVENVAAAIVKYITKSVKANSNDQISNTVSKKSPKSSQNLTKIYIASPADEFAFLNKVREKIESEFPTLKIHLSNDFEQKLDESYKNCKFYKQHKGEVLSLLDQAVATESVNFLKWPASSWSGRVMTLRKMKGHTVEPVTIVDLLEQHIGTVVSANFWRDTIMNNNIIDNLEHGYEMVKSEVENDIVKIKYGANKVMHRKIDKIYDLYSSVAKLL